MSATLSKETASHLDGHAALPHGLQVSTQQATVTLALANGLHAVVICHTQRHGLHVAKHMLIKWVPCLPAHHLGGCVVGCTVQLPSAALCCQLPAS